MSAFRAQRNARVASTLPLSSNVLKVAVALFSFPPNRADMGREKRRLRHRDHKCGWTHHQHCRHPLWTAPSVSACSLSFCNRWFCNSYLLPIADVNCTHNDVSRDINIVRDHYFVLSTIVSISLVLGLVVNLNLIQQLRVQPRSSSTCRSSILYHMRLERVRIWVK